MIDAYVALGSNRDGTEERIRQAFLALNSFTNTHVLATSSLYRTKPWGGIIQPDFINAAVKLKTSLSPQALLASLLNLEKQHGRIREQKNGPRTLDCDLLIYARDVIDEDNLKVPHPKMHLRSFVLLPLFDIAPKLMIFEKTITHWVSQCDCSDIVKLNCFKEEVS